MVPEQPYQSQMMDAPRLSQQQSKFSRKSNRFGSNIDEGSYKSDGKKPVVGVLSLKVLNPELVREQQQHLGDLKDPTYECVQRLKERYSYHEMRQQRVQIRNEEMCSEIKQKDEEK